MNRRRPRLAPESTGPQPWQVRRPDGTILGPLSLEQLRALVESGVVTAASELAPADGCDWQAIGTQPIWLQVAPARKPLVLRGQPAPPMPIATPHHAASVALDATRRALERAQVHREAELARLVKRAQTGDLARLIEVLGFATSVAGCVGVGDLLFFALGPLWGSAIVSFSLVALTRILALWFIWRILQ